jgi:transcriptional regulator with XRE-family HTH domain
MNYLAKQLEDPIFRAEYEALEPEFTVVQAIIDARKNSGLTQKQLSEKSGIAQGDISKIEHGNVNPPLKTLQRLATAMDMRLKLEFVPTSNARSGTAG